MTTSATTTTSSSPVASLLTIESISDISAFQDLHEEWNELLAGSDSDCLFLTWEWLFTWWKHLSGNLRLSLFVVRAGGRMVALAPLGLKPVSLLHRRPLPVLQFLGTGCVGSDYLDFIVRRGWEAEARQVFLSTLAGERVVLDCAQLRPGSFAAQIASELVRSDWTCSERITNRCPFISLTSLSWEEYLRTLGSEHRYNFSRKMRKLDRDYTVSFEQVIAPEECRRAIDLVIELHNLRWRDRGNSDAFHIPALVDFHREFSLLALTQGWLRLYTLRLDDKPAACLYGFLYHETFYFYQSGLDPAFQKQSVGLVSMGLGIKSAIQDGAKQYDLLHGEEEYKSHWSRERRELVRLELYPPGRLGKFCRSSAELERDARRMARRVLTRLSL